MSPIFPGKHHMTGMPATERPPLPHKILHTCLQQFPAALTANEFVLHSPSKMFQTPETSHIPLAENKFSQQHPSQQPCPTILSLPSLPSTLGPTLGSLPSAAVYVACHGLSFRHKITLSKHLHTLDASPREAPHVTSLAPDEKLLQQPSRHELSEVHLF